MNRTPANVSNRQDSSDQQLIGLFGSFVIAASVSGGVYWYWGVRVPDAEVATTAPTPTVEAEEPKVEVEKPAESRRKTGAEYVREADEDLADGNFWGALAGYRWGGASADKFVALGDAALAGGDFRAAGESYSMIKDKPKLEKVARAALARGNEGDYDVAFEAYKGAGSKEGIAVTCKDGLEKAAFSSAPGGGESYIIKECTAVLLARRTKL